MFFTKSDLCITKFDYDRLMKLLVKELKKRNAADDINQLNNVKKLLKQIKSAEKVDSKEIENYYVTMNSVLELKNLGIPQKLQFRLVFPDDANGGNDTVSVLSPVGIALLGSQQGGVIKWEMPVRDSFFQINKIIYQPEAAGDYHL